MTFVDALPPGRTIGEYLIGDPIGQGGFGIVYEARHPRHGIVAIKEFYPKNYVSRAPSGSVVASNPKYHDALCKGVERLVSEGEKLTSNPHRNIVHVYEVIKANGTGYLVMERVEGLTLAQAVKDKRVTPNAKFVADFLEQMLSALAEMHAKGLIHRDIAPDNVLVETTSMNRFVLIDFGAAKWVTTGASEGSSKSITKEGYSAPEQYSSLIQPSAATDIYGLSATLRWLVTGEKPLAASDRQISDTMAPLAPWPPEAARAELEANYGRPLLEAIDAGMILVQGNRPQTTEMFREAVTTGVRPAKKRSTPFIPTWAAALALCAAIGATAFALTRSPSQEPTPKVELAQDNDRQLLNDYAAMLQARTIESLDSFLSAYGEGVFAAHERVTDAKALAQKAARLISDYDVLVANPTASGFNTFLANYGAGDFSNDRRVIDIRGRRPPDTPKPVEPPKPAAPKCRTVNEPQQACKNVTLYTEECNDQESSDTVYYDFSDTWSGWVSSVYEANQICETQASFKAKQGLKKECDGKLSFVEISCSCDWDPSSPTGASCEVEAEAECETTEEQCKNVPHVEQQCETIMVPKQVCN